MPSKFLNAIITNEVYPFDVLVSFNESDRDFNITLNGLTEYSDDVLSQLHESNKKRGRTVMFSGNQTVLRLNFWPETPEDYGMLQHEIFHVVEFIMNRVGMKLSNKSDEAYAYMIGFYTKKIYELIQITE